MIIRKATIEDIPWMLDEGKTFLGLISENKNYYNRDHLEKLLVHIVTEGIIFVTEKDENLTGVIGGLKIPNIYNGDLMTLVELFWWVPEDYRKTRAGYLLMKAFEEAGSDVDSITFSSMDFSPINEDALIKRGFKKRESSFVKEVV